MNPTMKIFRKFFLFPTKIGEILGVHHMKYLIFDDNILLTGYFALILTLFIFRANLNQSYFTNRIDRYILFKNSSEFSKFFLTLTSYLSEIYYIANEDGSFAPPSSLHRTRFKTTLPINLKSPMELYIDSETVCIYPCLQMAKHGIFCDSSVSKILYSKLSSLVEAGHTSSNAYFCTSYFNVSHSDLEKFLLRNFNWKIITSSPQSNSFHKSSGVSSIIPNLYQFMLQKFYKNSEKSNSDPHIYEFDCPEKSFHAKGYISSHSVHF